MRALWARWSPLTRWRQRAREVDAAFRRLSLAHADRAAALVLHDAPILPLANEMPGRLHPYTAAFVARHERSITGDPDFVFTFAAAARAEVSIPHRETVAVECDGGNLVWSSPDGAMTVDIGTPDATGAYHTALPSIAHAVLRSSLSDAEISALVRDPGRWTPRLEHHPEMRVPAPPARLVLDDRSRGWTLVGSSVVLALTLPALVLVLRVFVQDLAWRALLPLLFLVPLAVANGRRLGEVVWLEPRARRLRLDDGGLNHPTTGTAISWRECRDLRTGAWDVQLTLPDGHQLTIPRSLFRDPDAAWLYLAARVGRSGPGPFRQRP